MNSYMAKEKNRLSESNDFFYGIERILLGGHAKRATARIKESYALDIKWAYCNQIPYTMTRYAVY